MYLKSLEMQGFKSFPDRTVIRFTDGMTAIVGPNGSGKSNISDAIRWVLGEQSTKSLRGAKMEDVIFGGTAKRGAMGFAQVTLILDNSAGQFPVDATEVMVSRKYYRSGDSEYAINRKRVRLRDVREVFMDTGLGHDGYSIIGQGRIDEILAVKSADRREVFEEAAGVTRFRTRKEEAERKLDQTAENLVRIRDIWSELDARSGPLEKQAESAKQYLLLRDELRLHEVSLWLHTLDGMKDAREQAERARLEAAQQLEQARAKQQTQYDRSEQISGQMQQSDMQADGLQRALSDAEQQAADLSRRAAVLEESRRNATENIGQTKGQLQAQREQSSALAQQIQAREARLTELEHEAACTRKTLDHVQEEIAQVTARIDGGQQQTQKLRAHVDACNEKVFAAQADRRAAEGQLEAMDARHDTVDGEMRDAQQRMQAAADEQTAMQRQMDALEAEITQDETRQKQQRDAADEAARALREARRDHAEQQAALIDSQNRVRMLTELQRDYEGFSRAVKLVMGRAQSGELNGVRGPLSSLIHVSDDCVTAIETALGAAASNIIVEHAEDGRDAIALLKKRDGGRATFLPMDTIRPQSLRETGLERADGFVGIAAELVQCEPDYRAIVQNALGRTVVMRDMNCALRMARQYHNRFRIVTLDGQIINAGGSMTGGSVGRSSGILSRANQLEQMKQRAAGQQKRLDALTARGKQLAQQAEQTAQEAEKASTALAAKRQTLAAKRAQAQQHQLLVDNLTQAERQLRTEQADAAQLRDRLRQRIDSLGKTIEELTGQRERAAQQLGSVAGQTEETAQTLAALGEQAAQLRTTLAQGRTEQDSIGQALADLRKMMDSAQSTADEQVRRLEEYETGIRQAGEELAALEMRAAQTEQEIQRLRGALQDCGKARMGLEKEKNDAERQAREIGQDIVLLERRHTETEAAAQRIRGEEQQILDRMWDSYELTPTAARPLAHAVTDKPEEEKQAAELRRSIKALGPVNLAAVEEYTALRERLTFLTEQKDDLEQAERELRGVIEQLTEQMKEVFAASFAQLNQYFGETFREIFDGGNAELRLEDETDILGCGIEINVTPPGKTVKSLSLLSGGEKAFVAIALYFAILKVRPTPFCVLDEIEAALDDVNVTRFAQYLRRLSDKTQFIIITHRRGTMEEADMLYGVTMQERGVSKLLMLNISDVEKRLGLELK